MTTPALAGQAARVADPASMSGDGLREADDATVRETSSTLYEGGMAAFGHTHKAGKPGEVVFENLSPDVRGGSSTAAETGISGRGSRELSTARSMAWTGATAACRDRQSEIADCWAIVCAPVSRRGRRAAA